MDDTQTLALQALRELLDNPDGGVFHQANIELADQRRSLRLGVSHFAVDVFEPKTTPPPNRAARPATITIGSNVTTPRVVAAIRIPPRPMAAFANVKGWATLKVRPDEPMRRYAR
jgi:hypothetical protein